MLESNMTNTVIEQSVPADPSSLRRLRDALGGFTTGVTVITTQTDQGPAAFTANSFASVSLDPALVLWSAARASARFPVFAAAKTYSIHILADDQSHLIARFIRGGTGFDGLDTQLSVDGNPVLDGAVARFDCHQHAVHDGGDHLIILGRVVQFFHREARPLVFSQGAYGQFVPGA